MTRGPTCRPTSSKLTLSLPSPRGPHPPAVRSGGGGVVWCGGGGGGEDASIGPCRLSIPLGGADACTPRQVVTLLYGPSICTPFVQMDLRRSQVRRPFPTLGSGTLWVARGALAGQA